MHSFLMHPSQWEALVEVEIHDPPLVIRLQASSPEWTEKFCKIEVYYCNHPDKLSRVRLRPDKTDKHNIKECHQIIAYTIIVK